MLATGQTARDTGRDAILDRWKESMVMLATDLQVSPLVRIEYSPSGEDV